MRAALEANRLTDTARAAIRAALAGLVGPSPTVAGVDMMKLERAAWRAIGCTYADLRDSELAEISGLVAAAAGLDTVARVTSEPGGVYVSWRGGRYRLARGGRVCWADGPGWGQVLAAEWCGVFVHRHYGSAAYGHVDYFAVPAVRS